MSDDIRKKRRKQPKKKSELDEAANTTEKASDNKTSEAEKASSTLVNSDQDTDFKSNWWWIKTVLFLCIVGNDKDNDVFDKEFNVFRFMFSRSNILQRTLIYNSRC